MVSGQSETWLRHAGRDSGVDLDATVLKVAHQGSRYSSSAEFLEAVSPRVAIISAGEDNRFGHPHPETLERLESLSSAPAVLRTDMHGTVTLTTDGRALVWEGHPSTGSGWAAAIMTESDMSHNESRYIPKGSH